MKNMRLLDHRIIEKNNRTNWVQIRGGEWENNKSVRGPNLDHSHKDPNSNHSLSLQDQSIRDNLSKLLELNSHLTPGLKETGILQASLWCWNLSHTLLTALSQWFLRGNWRTTTRTIMHHTLRRPTKSISRCSSHLDKPIMNRKSKISAWKILLTSVHTWTTSSFGSRFAQYTRKVGCFRSQAPPSGVPS